MQQFVIGQDEGHHRCDHGGAADADAGVVAAFGEEFGGRSISRYRGHGGEDGAGGLEGDADHDGLAGADAPDDAAGVVGVEVGA